MEYKAGQRMAMLRELVGITQKELSEQLGVDLPRIKNCENLRARVSEREYEGIAESYVELFPFFAYEGPISSEALRNSANPRCRLVISRLEAGDLDDNPAKEWIR